MRFCLVNRRLAALGDAFDQLWESVEAAPMHMFRVYSMAESWLAKRRGAIQRLTLAPVMRGRPAVHSAEMEDVVCQVLEGLEGGALQQLSIISLVQAGPGRSPYMHSPSPLLAGEAFKLPHLQELRFEGNCRVDYEFGRLTALTSLHLGPGAHPALHYHSYSSDGQLPASLACLHIEDDAESYTRRSALPASVRQLGGALRQLYLAGGQLAALPLRHLQHLSGLTSLVFLDRGHYASLGVEAHSDSESGSGSDTEGDGSSSSSYASASEGGGDDGGSHGGEGEAAAQAASEASAASAAAAAAAAAVSTSVPAGVGVPPPQLLPELRELGLGCAKWLPLPFAALTALSFLQLQGMPGEGDVVPDLVWQLPSLKVGAWPGGWQGRAGLCGLVQCAVLKGALWCSRAEQFDGDVVPCPVGAALTAGGGWEYVFEHSGVLAPASKTAPSRM